MPKGVYERKKRGTYNKEGVTEAIEEIANIISEEPIKDPITLSDTGIKKKAEENASMLGVYLYALIEKRLEFLNMPTSHRENLAHEITEIAKVGMVTSYISGTKLESE